MIDEIDLETYLNISFNKFEIYLFDKKNSINLFKNELIFEKKKNDIDLYILSKFLEENIFKIEKKIGKFIKNIFLIIETNSITNIDIGIKKKNYNDDIKKNDLENSITELKDLIKENYQDEKIIHMIVKRFLVNGVSNKIFQKNIKGDYFCLEIEFKSISSDLSLKINRVLEKYQIEIIQFLDHNYIKDLFKNENIEFSKMISLVISGQNLNEVKLITKNHKKIGFFEKFFQLFS